MIRYEFKKLFGYKFLYLSFVALFILNGIMCLISVKDLPYQSEEKHDIDTLFQLYYENPSDVTKKYDSLRELIRLNDIAQRESIESGTDFEPSFSIPSNTISENISDNQLYGILFDTIDYVKNYQLSIDDLIAESKSNLSELDTSSYAYNYQIKVIDIYTKTKTNVLMGLEYRSGWDIYFSYYTGDVFVFIILLMTGSLVFTQEFSRGSISIIYPSKKGRTIFAINKILTAYLLTIVTVLLFSLEAFFIIGIKLGYSNPQNALQFLTDFLYSPFPISIISFYIISLILKVLAYLLFSTIVIAISLFLKKQALVYITGVSFWGINFLLYKLSNTNSPLKHFNIISLTYVTSFFDRYRAINIFNHAVGYCDVLPIILIGSIMLVSVFIIVTFNHIRSSHNKANQNLRSRLYVLLQSCQRSPTSSTKKQYTTRLLPYEFFKILISSRFAIIIAIILVVECFSTLSSINKESSQSDMIYQEYMSELQGEYSSEKKDFITEERKKISTVLAQYNEKQTLFTNGILSTEELKLYLNEYNYAISHSAPLELVETQARYLEHLKSKEITAWFIYDTGWKRLLNPPIDWLLLIALTLVISCIFSIEYSSKSSDGSFSYILRATRSGRKLTWQTKYVVTISISLLLTFLWNTIHFVSIYLFYELPLMKAPIVSISIFEEFSPNLTVIQYIIILYIFKLFASVLFSCFICSLSSILKSPIATMSTTVIITMLPRILSNMGLTFLSNIDFTNLLCGTPLFINTTHPIIFCVIAVSICIITMNLSERMWTQ